MMNVAFFVATPAAPHLVEETMLIVAALCLASVALAADVSMNMAGGNYNFGYNTGDGQSRTESGSGGSVSGSYSYIDANGDQRTVSYTAGPNGFQPSGDIGVDRKTAAEAAAIAALAPKAPPAQAPVAPAVAPWYYYGYPGTVFMSVNPGLASYSAHW